MLRGALNWTLSPLEVGIVRIFHSLSKFLRCFQVYGQSGLCMADNFGACCECAEQIIHLWVTSGLFVMCSRFHGVATRKLTFMGAVLAFSMNIHG